jgi:hypothetical protein
MSAAVAAGRPGGASQLDPLVLADFEAGLDGLHENDLIDEAEVDSIVRETILHTIGDTPWSDTKASCSRPAVRRAIGPQLNSFLRASCAGQCLD